MTEDVRPDQRDLVRHMGNMQRRLPQSMRELLEFLSYYDVDRGLEYLLSMLDVTGVTPGHVYNVVHNRAPETLQLAAPGAKYDARHHLREALLSQDFRQKILRNFLRAFPEKGRDVFIHIPKCAGTDLIFSLVRKSLPLPKMIEIHGWVSDEEFLTAISGIARSISSHDRFFIYGHMELGEYLDFAGRRPSDRIFTIIREPLDLMLSQANYAIGRLRQDPAGRDPDTAETLAYLGIARLPESATNRDLKDLTIRALLDHRISQPNRACFYLGKGQQMDYTLAMTHVVAHNIEITTTRHYQRWLQERWGIDESVHHNESVKILSRAEVGRLYADLMTPSMEQDQMLFDVVSWALQQTDKSSAHGLEIARLAGPDLLGAFPRELRARQNSGEAFQQGGNAHANLLVAQKPEFVALYLESPSIKTPGAADVHPILEIICSDAGNALEYIARGWSDPEPDFIWTDGHESVLRLPPLQVGQRYVLRLIGHPFVVQGRHEWQRVEVLVNGVPQGNARIHDRAVIECEIPSEAIRFDEPIILTLRLPDAARPVDLNHGNDRRLLGLAVQSVIVLQVTPAPT